MGARVNEAHGQFMRECANRVLAMPPEERAAYLAEQKKRHDALGYAAARERAAVHGLGDFGSPSHSHDEVAAPTPALADDPKAEIAAFEAPPPPLVAYTDGSGTIASQPSGAGVVVFDGDVVVLESSRHLGNGTNNHAELSGVRIALVITDTPEWRSRRLIVRSDSTYTINALTSEYSPREGAPNERLINIVRSLLVGRSVTFEHVKGHSGIAGNERADELAGLARVRPQPVPELQRAG